MSSFRQGLRPTATAELSRPAKRSVEVRAATDESPFAALHAREQSPRYQTAVRLITTQQDDEGNPIERSQDEVHRRATRLVAKWDARDAEEQAFRDKLAAAREGFMAEHGDLIRRMGRTKPQRLEAFHYMTGDYDPDPANYVRDVYKPDNNPAFRRRTCIA